MISLRKRLWLGFGGVLLILAVVCAMSVAVLTRYSNDLEAVMRENYHSITYCDQMKSALGKLEETAAGAARNERELLTREQADAIAAAFRADAETQIRNSFLPGEVETSRQVLDQFNQYHGYYLQLYARDRSPWDTYVTQLRDRYASIMTSLQQISDMNLRNMATVNARLTASGTRVRNTLVIVAALGVIMAAAYVTIVATSILSQLKDVTRSAVQIQAGNLDLQLDVRSKDELGQLAAAFNDMTAKLRQFRRDDQDRLTRTRRTTQLAIDSLLEPVLVADPQGRIEIANRAATRLLGIETDQNVAAARWLADLHHGVVAGEVPTTEGYKSAIQVFDDGKELFLLPRAVPMVDDAGKTIGVTIILLDVTQLRHADELKSGLLSTVSHELRTPLTGLQMSVHLLLDPAVGDLTDKQRELLTTAVDCSDRLYRVIDHLLNVSRIEAGKLPLNLQPVSPADLIQQACDTHRDEFKQAQIELATAVPANLPRISVDPASIQYVFTNLLSNARKYSPAGTRVTVGASATHDGVTFSVFDAGPGIPEQYRQLVFEKFFRIPNPGGPSGAGLGLSIAREIVLAHGGRLYVHDHAMAGSDFRFTIPLAV